jgi:regulator of PEP synthase PpsR (kinase-PPPase family)
MPSGTLQVFVVSDGTGATGSALVKAGLVLFKDGGGLDADVSVTRFPNTRTDRAVDRVLDRAKAEGAFVVHTFGSGVLRKRMNEGGASRRLPMADAIGPLVESFSKFLHRRPGSASGVLHRVDEEYFRRIDAVEFAVMHDDSKATAGLPFADIVLAGVSRTGKTPLSVYLALEGWRVANIALVPNQPPPPELDAVEGRKVVGLVIDPFRLGEIRRSRMRHLGQGATGYDDPDKIEDEIRWSRTLFRQKGWFVLDTTERSIEESANAVLDRVIGSDRHLKEI